MNKHKWLLLAGGVVSALVIAVFTHGAWLRDNVEGTCITAAETSLHRGESKSVCFEVKSIGGSRSAAFLNSENDYRDDANFYVYLPGRIDTAALNGQYLGRRLRTTGRIIPYRNHLEIIVTNLSQLELL
jgi:hypothetical protein